MTLILAFAASFLCGARAFLTLALTAWAISLGHVDVGSAPLDWLGAPALAAILTLLAFGEIYGDKQPQMGSRTRLPALLARMVAGLLVGSALGAAGGMALAGALIGAAAAAAGTFATFHARRLLASRFGRDLPTALAEDVLVLVLSLLIIWAA